MTKLSYKLKQTSLTNPLLWINKWGSIILTSSRIMQGRIKMCLLAMAWKIGRGYKRSKRSMILTEYSPAFNQDTLKYDVHCCATRRLGVKSRISFYF